MKSVLIIGGGLAGLVAGLTLAGKGARVTLVERKQYPFHRVCGEYISNEVIPFLRELGVNPNVLRPAAINRLFLSSPTGNFLTASLDLGGFGISRYTFDHYLFTLAQERGVEFILNTSVTNVIFTQDQFEVHLSDGRQLSSNVVIGAYGKRANLDRQLQRNFFQQRSPYIGVKYHVRTDSPRDLISCIILKTATPAYRPLKTTVIVSVTSLPALT